MDVIDIKKHIKDELFSNLREHEVFGNLTLWQDFMQREVTKKLSEKEMLMFEEAIRDLINANILEQGNGFHFLLTQNGQDLVFLKDEYTEDKVKDTILSYLQDNYFCAGDVWQRCQVFNYYESKLNIFEKYIFFSTISKMIDEGIFIRDSIGNLELTKFGQDMVYGIR